MGENQDQSMLRSINNRYRSFVKFINKTFRPIRVYWIDYQGNAVSYGDLSPEDTMDIDTFVTHPWIFVDRETKDRYMVNQKDVFFPEPWFARYRSGAVYMRGRRIDRTYVYITLPVYTLQELSLRAIRKCLTYDLQAFLLDIPRRLQFELAVMLPRTQSQYRLHQPFSQTENK